MPTYDYQCRRCGHTIEVIHSMLGEGPTSCERCGGELRRVFHPTGIIFKGSGFYKTDSRSSDASSTASKSASSTSDASAGDGSSGGAKDAKGGDAAKPSGTTPSGDAKPRESG